MADRSRARLGAGRSCHRERRLQWEIQLTDDELNNQLSSGRREWGLRVQIHSAPHSSPSESGGRRAAHDREREDRRASRRLDPFDAIAEAVRAIYPREELVVPAGDATLDTQLVLFAAFPIRACLVRGNGDRFADFAAIRFAQLPKIALQWVDMIPPCPCTNAIFASLTCRGPHSPRNCGSHETPGGDGMRESSPPDRRFDKFELDSRPE